MPCAASASSEPTRLAPASRGRGRPAGGTPRKRLVDDLPGIEALLLRRGQRCRIGGQPGLPGQPTRSSTAAARLPRSPPRRRRDSAGSATASARWRGRTPRPRPRRGRTGAARPVALEMRMRRLARCAPPGQVGHGAPPRPAPRPRPPALPGSAVPSTPSSVPAIIAARCHSGARRVRDRLEHAAARASSCSPRTIVAASTSPPRVARGDSAAPASEPIEQRHFARRACRSAPRRRRSDRRRCLQQARHRRVAVSPLIAPSVAASCRRTDQSGSVVSASTAVGIDGVARRRASAPTAAAPTSARRARSPSAPPSPAPASARPCRRASTARAAGSARPARAAASLVNAGTTAASSRSTSRRCAVSRRQPFGCDSICDERRGRRRRHRRLAIAPRRLVDDAVDAAVADRLLEAVARRCDRAGTR